MEYMECYDKRHIAGVWWFAAHVSANFLWQIQQMVNHEMLVT